MPDVPSYAAYQEALEGHAGPPAANAGISHMFHSGSHIPLAAPGTPGRTLSRSVWPPRIPTSSRTQTTAVEPHVHLFAFRLMPRPRTGRSPRTMRHGRRCRVPDA